MPPDSPTDPVRQPLQGLSGAAEEKRKIARRKFLLGSTAAGTGLLVTTLCHQRAAANVRAVSTLEACTSLHGNVVLKRNARNELDYDMVNSSVGGSTKYYQCEIKIG
ncbi:MAG: hypothetical protein ABW318_04010 [Vicinamibacterales bacterium]